MTNSLTEIARKTRESSRILSALSTEERNQAIEAIAHALETHSEAILTANKLDCEQAEKDHISSSLYARLKLDENKLKSAITGVRDVAKLADPLGQVSIHRELDQGLIMKRISCSLGVLGVIFEARPDAVIQISSLAIKSGNAVILKGGKEAINSCTVLVNAIKKGLETTKVNPDVIQILTTREETNELLKQDKYVDLIIPRGSNSFVKFVQENTKIPVLGHADGICHLFIDESADMEKAIAITIDSKTQYVAACNAIETLLVHEHIAAQFLPLVAKELQRLNVELKGDENTRKIIDILPANDQDWKTEYSDLILSIKVVNSLEEAINHINNYGSRHTEGIVTENQQNVEQFFSQIDAAGVYHNCSTRFADGFRYGFGAEVGISTQKMPPRGPVGLEGLVTYKYQMMGTGQIVATYAGSNAKPFTHRDLS
jgi:glutamate-5-semialdehyde dehydrogenase